MANIRLVTFSNEVVTPQNDGVIYNHTVAQDGMLTDGFLATIKNDTTVHLTWGLGMIAGREFEVQEQDITIPLSGGSATQGRLYFHMDLSNSSTPIDILFDTETTPLPYDDNVNVTNGVCEVELCHFAVNGISISDLVQTFNTLPSGASSVAYDGTSSGLSATDVQGAIDEVNTKVDKIGYTYSTGFTSLSLPNDTYTKAAELTNLPKGTYIVVSVFNFPTGTTGVRRSVTYPNSTTVPTFSRYNGETENASTTGTTVLQYTRALTINENTNTIGLAGYHNNGSAIANCSGMIYATRIA